jgi:hypothetical protein
MLSPSRLRKRTRPNFVRRERPPVNGGLFVLHRRFVVRASESTSRGSWCALRIVHRAGSARGIPFAATLAWSEPLTALLRSARSRVSSSRSLWKAATGTPHASLSGSVTARASRKMSAYFARRATSNGVLAWVPAVVWLCGHSAPTCGAKRHVQVETHWKEGEGVLVRPLQTSARRRPATERSEGAQLGAPTKRVCGLKRIPSPDDRQRSQNEREANGEIAFACAVDACRAFS